MKLFNCWICKVERHFRMVYVYIINNFLVGMYIAYVCTQLYGQESINLYCGIHLQLACASMLYVLCWYVFVNAGSSEKVSFYFLVFKSLSLILLHIFDCCYKFC